MVFGHGSKPDRKVWVIAALGDDIMNARTHTLTHVQPFSATVLLG